MYFDLLVGKVLSHILYDNVFIYKVGISCVHNYVVLSTSFLVIISCVNLSNILLRNMKMSIKDLSRSNFSLNLVFIFNTFSLKKNTQILKLDSLNFL